MEQLDEKYQPLSPWAYFGLEILYSIPVIGFIVLLIHAIAAPNINKRNFAKSFFCIYVVILIIFGLSLVLGGAEALKQYFQSLLNK